MRFAFIALSLSVLFVWGCSKGNKTPVTPYYPDDYGAFAYRVEGLHDTFAERIGEAALLLALKKESGPAEDVTFTAEGLPPGVEITFEPPAIKPDNNVFVHIKTKRTPEGDYKITLQSKSKSTGVKTHSFQLLVKPYSNAATPFFGEFTETHMCAQDGSKSFGVFMEPVKGTANRVAIKGLWSGVWNNIIYADLDQAHGKVVIPKQKLYDLEYEGSGSYNDEGFTISYTVTDGVVINESCTATLLRK